MFGYQCYSVNGKFFVGFNKKDKTKIIIRLSKDMQKEALADGFLEARPFSHGAKMGWIEIETTNEEKAEAAFLWVRKGYLLQRFS
jgi:predicted DNA-binding protein (MmcQ/YjbR family)